MRLKIRASMTSILCRTAVLAALALAADPAGAQFLLQYTPPGGPQERPESRREELERAVRDAPYHLGPLRIAPWATLRNVSYVRSVFSDGQELPADLTATVGAGFRAYLRNSSKATWTAQVLPEYVWWQKQTRRRQVNGRYLLNFDGYFNRLTVEMQAGRQQQQRIVTPEVPVPVSARTDGAEILAELRVASRFYLFTVTAFNRQSNQVSDTPDPLTGDLRVLDRDERIERLGVRWRPGRRWSIGLAGERSDTDFTRKGVFDRSNSGSAEVAEIRFRGNRLSLQSEIANRSLTAKRGAELVPFDGVTGNAALIVGGEARLSATLYASRDVVYSLSAFYPYLTDERLGAALGASFGQRTRGRIFVEGGRNDYTAITSAPPRRREDVSSYGGSLTYALRPSLRVGLDGVRSHFDSNLPGQTRTYTAVGVTVTLADLP